MLMLHVCSERETRERHLLVVVLALILINNYSIPQGPSSFLSSLSLVRCLLIFTFKVFLLLDTLFRHLESLHLGPAGEQSWWTNAIAKNFVKQLYLSKVLLPFLLFFFDYPKLNFHSLLFSSRKRKNLARPKPVSAFPLALAQ